MHDDKRTTAAAGPVLTEGLGPGAYRHFEGMTWPVPGERLDELESALRFAERGAVFSMSDRMVIASFLSAYRELVALPARARDARVRELRKGPRTSYGTTPGPNQKLTGALASG